MGLTPLLYATCHGFPDGSLADDDSNNSYTYSGNTVTLNSGGTWYPGAVIQKGRIIIPSEIDNSKDWNDDVDWVHLDACSQLNPTGGGKVAWEHALKGSPHRAHGILGAYDLVDGDLNSHIATFWQNMRNGMSIPASYRFAMEYNQYPQPWAELYYVTCETDRLKEMTQDASG